MLEISLNLIIIILLVPTIVFAVILNRRLEVLRNSRNDLGRLIEAFNDATTRAESGIPRLKQAADSTGNALREQIQKAQMLRDDLAFMIERADVAAGKMEQALTTRGNAPVSAEKKTFSFADAKEFAVRDTDTVVAETQKKRKKRPIVETPEEIISSAVSAAQDILRLEEQVAVKAEAPSYAGNERLSFSEDEERSEAERELLKALRAMR